MTTRWSALLFFCLTLLSGCLQVELRGPVSGARISVTPLRGGAPLGNGTTTADEALLEQQLGEERWSDFSNAVKALMLGTAEVPEGNYVDDKYYLVTATGGSDNDSDNNGLLDDPLQHQFAPPARIDRSIHAIMSGAQLKKSLSRVNLLTEAIYRVLEPELDELSDAELGARLKQLARKVVGDVNEDDRVNYRDVLQWSNFSKKEHYRGSPEFLQRLPRAISDSLYSKAIISLDSENAVERADLRPSRETSLWANAIIGCSHPIVFGDLCNMQTLPFLGRAGATPTVSDIMKRVVTSEPWIAINFQRVLKRMPDDILLLFRSVTAIVLGTEIRPSYFDPSVGAIYLDAENFWLDSTQRGTVSTEPDYRAEYANAVDFAHVWRYVDGDEDAFEGLYIADVVGYRTLEDIELSVAQLLLHELAHAADAFRPGLLGSISAGTTPFHADIPVVSDELLRFRPLQSDTLMGIADVLFFGTEPTEQQANYSPSYIAKQFAPDKANDLYSYFSQYEDAAMLFEEAMMDVLFDVQRDIAFTTLPDVEFADEALCEDFLVRWGVRGRIAVERVSERAGFVVDALLPEKNYARQLGQLTKPVPLQNGRSWCDSLAIDQSNGIIVPLRKSLMGPAFRRWSNRSFL